jgi:hypothetical protein
MTRILLNQHYSITAESSGYCLYHLETSSKSGKNNWKFIFHANSLEYILQLAVREITVSSLQARNDLSLVAYIDTYNETLNEIQQVRASESFQSLLRQQPMEAAH